MCKALNLACAAIVGFALVVPPALAQDQKTEREAVIKSFRQYVANHIDSYKTDRRERAAWYGAGQWSNEYYEAISDFSIDIQSTNSLISPYAGVCEFSLIRHNSKGHNTKTEAEKDENFVVQSSPVRHRHTYVYQDGIWVPKSREHYADGLNEWFDCNEIIHSGENKGATNVEGCWEKTGK